METPLDAAVPAALSSWQPFSEGESVFGLALRGPELELLVRLEAGGTPDPALEEQPNPESCHAQLTKATSDYQRLLWITISICTCFCVAMVIVIALVALMILLTRASFLRHRSPGEEYSPTDQEVKPMKRT